MISRPLRVLILTYIYTDYDPRYGGEGRVVWETTNALAREGVEVYVITSMKKLQVLPHPNVHLYQIPFAKKDFLNFNAGELLKIFFWSIPLILWKGIDVIHHLPTNGPDLFARFKFGRVFAMSADPAWDYENPKFGEELRLDNAQKMQEAGLHRGKKSFDLSSRLALRFFRLLGVNEKFPKGVDVFFPRARSLEKSLRESNPKSEIVYVPNGVDTDAFSPKTPPLFPRTQKGVRFLHVGSISRRKGTLHLVNAFLQVHTKHPDSELYLVGRGHPDFIAELKEKAGAYSENIRFFSDISNKDLPGAYTSADVFCLVPLSGSTPTVMGEALASGLPIISTRESGSGEAVEEYDAGLLVEAGNDADLADKMISFIEDPSLMHEKSRNALSASHFFSWQHIAKTLKETYHQALKRHT